MKRLIISTIAISMLTLSMISCQKNLDNNNDLEFDVLNVNFGGDQAGKPWNEGDEIGIYSSCTRDGKESVSMSTNANAKYIASITGEEVRFSHASDEDLVVAMSTDHNFKFHAYFPYSESNTDMSAIRAEVPSKQYYSKNGGKYGLYVASKQVTTIVPTVKFDFKGVFSTIELHVPNDIIDSDGNSAIRSLTLQPAVPENFDGVLADGGTYNLESGVFTSNAGMQANKIEIDFGNEGIVLTDAYTKISIAVAPFTVPEGGMSVVIKDMDEKETTFNILAQESDKGTVLAAGEVLTQYLSKFSDGIIPVDFPVVFPVGVVDGYRNFTQDIQPRWTTEGIWTCPTQTQAYAKWNKVSDPLPSPTQVLATVNSGDISSPSIRGIWTGDYLEFVLPVRDFKAGTAVTTKFPMYTRQGPVFWNIEYLDGDEWKSNREDITCYDPNYTREATFSLVRGGKIIEHTMVFTKKIDSGYLKIRFTCADGTIQASTDTTVDVRTAPWIDGTGAYGAPFYFYLAGSDVTSISFSIN